MNRDEVQRRLEEFMRLGQPHRAWDFARELIERPGNHALRRALKYRILHTCLPRWLPSSFWDERRREEARRLELEPPRPVLRVGVVAFPVVFPAPESGCFVAASVRFIESPQDELPDDREIDETARRAMAEALEAARRLTGGQQRFRVALDKAFPEPVKGASCGLAVALAALSCIDERGLDDSISATGEVTRELLVRPVLDVDRKSALRREARPLALLLCPIGSPAEDGLLPVLRLEDALAAAWKPTPQATEEALTAFKRERAQHPDNLFLRFRGLARLARGSSQTRLPLLGFAVAPSLRDERQEEAEAKLRDRLREPDLSPEDHRKLEREIAMLERRSWRSPREPDAPSHTFSLATALRRFKRFTVIGDPGAGKSLLTRLAFLACAENETGRQARTLLGADAWYKPDEAAAIQSLEALLPVRLELGRFGEALEAEKDLSLEAFIRRQLRAEGASATLRDGFRELLREGRLFVLCDGLDEVMDTLRECVVDAVSDFVRAYDRVRILVTSRPHGRAPDVPGFSHTWLAPLDFWQRRTLMARLHRLVESERHPGPEGLRLARHRTNELLQAIEQRGEWQELISNPLLLTLSSLARTNEKGVPEHQVIVFEGLIQTILEEWRDTLKRLSGEADHLLAAWHAVAFELVSRQQRHGVGRGHFLRLLTARLGEGTRVTPNRALNLALETGLVQESGTTIKFWHSTFAEFLAARFLAQKQGSNPEQFLSSRLTPLTLKFTVALLDHAFDAHDECNAIARALLERDAEGARPLLRPGLRTVSDWHADGVRFSRSIRERLWEAWLEVLEQTPPSPLWGHFGRFAERAPLTSPAPQLVARLARVADRGVEEIREGIARIIAPAASEPAARAACEQWLKAPTHATTLRLFGAFGLASAGDWSDAVIQALGRFGETRKLPPQAVRELVRGGGDAVLERLRDLVRQRFPSEEQQGTTQSLSPSQAPTREEPKELRLAAACLLAAAGHWDDDVARVMRLALSGSLGMFQDDELHAVVRFCASEGAVREVVLEWFGEGSTLGERARKLLLDVAPLFEDMPEKLLERMAGAGDEERGRLEGLLVSLAEELYTLPELLGRWLEEERPGEWRLCAARILRQLAPQDRRLHEALRHGMRSLDEVDRARWAHLAMRLEEGLSHSALETLAQCARSPDGRVRAAVYRGDPMQMPWKLDTERLEDFFAVASDREVSAQARLDALRAVERLERFREQVVPILHELLRSDDAAVRHSAATSLAWRGERSPEAAIILAEQAVWGDKDRYSHLPTLQKMPPLAALMVRTILRELSRKFPPGEPQDPRPEEMNWSFMLRELAEADLSCVDDLLRTLQQPGFAGKVSQLLLGNLLEKHAEVRGALRQALREAMTGGDHIRQFRLVLLGLEEEETRPEAIELSRAMAPASLTQAKSDRLAHKLHSAGEERAAAQLWRLALEGTEPGLVLDAAEMLVHHFPEEAVDWVQDGIHRSLSSPVAAHRLGAGRFALLFGVCEEQGLAALVGCLEKREESSWFKDGRWFRILSLSRYRELHPDDEVQLEQVLHWHSRIDFEAMYELCAHRPDVGLPHLAAWLDDQKLDRFSAAVKLLAGKEMYRERVSTALEHRLRSEPAGTLHIVIELIEGHGFYSKRMVEQFLGRGDVGGPVDYQLNWALSYWLRNRPELWAVFREQPTEQRDKLARWIHLSQPIQRDMIVFAVEFVLVNAATGDLLDVEYVLERLCEPQPAKKEQPEQPEEHSHQSLPEQVRGWMRAVLSEQKVLADLFALSAFDRLAAMAELPASERILRLRQALAMEATPTQDDGGQLQYHQGVAALRLVELGDRDERIPRVLEATVHLLAESNDMEAFGFASALKALQAPDAALRDTLVGLVLRASWVTFRSPVPELLEWVGLTAEDRIEVLTTRLKGRAKPHELPELLEALASLGCSREQREALLLEYAAAAHEEPLSPTTLVALAKRPELSVAAEARLLLSALAHSRRWDAEEALKRWIERFASQISLTEDRWWTDVGSNYLSSRQRALARLMTVDDPALVEQVLAEFATPHPRELLTLYRAARTGGDALSSESWRELLALLTAQPQDVNTTLFAKEWLSLGLWQVLEPETANQWFAS